MAGREVAEGGVRELCTYMILVEAAGLNPTSPGPPAPPQPQHPPALSFVCVCVCARLLGEPVGKKRGEILDGPVRRQSYMVD